MLLEIDYSRDPQNVSPYCYDIFGDEVYKDDIVYCGDEGMMRDPGDDNYDSSNPIMALLVQQLGTRYILEQLGYQRRKIDKQEGLC